MVLFNPRVCFHFIEGLLSSVGIWTLKQKKEKKLCENKCVIEQRRSFMTPLFNTWRVSDWRKTIRRRYLSKRSGLWGGQLAWLRSEEMRESQICLLWSDTNQKVTFWAFSWLDSPPATKCSVRNPWGSQRGSNPHKYSMKMMSSHRIGWCSAANVSKDGQVLSSSCHRTPPKSRHADGYKYKGQKKLGWK